MTTNAIDRLRAIKRTADGSNQARRDYAKFMQFAADVMGWSENDQVEYRQQIGVLMNGSDEQVLALFPEGLYKSAEEARQGAAEYWKRAVA